MTPTYRNTRLQDAGTFWENHAPTRRVRLWRVVVQATGEAVYGPEEWSRCCAWKRRLPGGPDAEAKP